MTRQTFAQKLAVRVLAREGMTAIWELHVAAAEAYQRGQSSVAAILIEIADAAEREWLLCCDGTSGRGKVQDAADALSAARRRHRAYPCGGIPERRSF
jgi:hypothetical protein